MQLCGGNEHGFVLWNDGVMRVAFNPGFKLISALRRSLNGETKENISRSPIGNQMNGTGNEIDSEKNFEHPDADSEDGFYEVLQNIFPSSSPHHICDPQENSSSQPEVADSGECSSSHENVEYFSGTEESENPVDTSLQKETSSKKVQCCLVKSVAVQCDSITYVSKGVQWEPLFMESRSVQCVPAAQVAKEVQCFIMYESQCEQTESVSLVTTGIQYEYPCAEEETYKKQSYSSKQLPVNVPFEESESVDCELVTEPSGIEDQGVLADLCITLPSVQGELVLVNSSQSSDCVDSHYSSHESDVDFPEDEHQVELYSSQPVPSTSGVKCKRKRKCANRVRKRKYSKKTNTHCRSESTKEKYTNKRLPLEARTDGNRSVSEGVNNDSGKIGSKGVQGKEANNVKKVLSSESKEASTFGKSGEKLIVEETPEELLEQMGINENCLAKENSSNEKNGVTMRVAKDKQQQIASQNIMNLSCSQSNARSSSGRSAEKLVIEESSEEFLQRMENDQDLLAKEDNINDNNVTSKRIIKDKQQDSASQKIINSPCQQSHSTSLVAATSESQRTGGLNWFSSLACERYSSPESFGEDMFEELKEDRPDCNKYLAHNVQSKNSKIQSDKLSFRNIRHSTPTEERNSARKPVNQNVEDNSRKPPTIKRKSASSKHSVQLVPYSNSDSDSCPDSSYADHFIETNKEMSKKNFKKKHHHFKSTLINNKLQKTGIIPSDLLKTKTHKGINCDRVSKFPLQSSQSNSKSVSEKNMVMSLSNSDRESENSGESSIVSRIKIRRSQRKSNDSEKNAVMSVSRSESSESENSSESEIVLRNKIKRVLSKRSDSEKNIGMSVSNSETENSWEADIVSRSKKRVQENKVNISTEQNPDSRTKSGNVSVHSPQVGNKHSIIQRDSVNQSSVHISIWSSDEDDIGSKISTVTYRTTASKGSIRRKMKMYVKEEREAILWYIIDHKYFKLVKGRAMWQRMEKEQVCIDRTWQSMKEHFLKKILPQIESFHLNPEITKKFLSIRK